MQNSPAASWIASLRSQTGYNWQLGAWVCGVEADVQLASQTSGNIYGFDPTGALITSPFSNKTINGGWTVGGGIEARLCGNLTARIEYLYLDLGTTHAIANNQNVTTLTTQFNSRLTDQVVRAGLNYKFY
jgi:opacity protein-like surface antigen